MASTYKPVIDTLTSEITSLHKQVTDGIEELRQRCRQLESHAGYKSIDKKESNGNGNLQGEQLEIIERIEKLYLFLEHIAMNKAKSFSDADKARLRKARAETQRIRLWLYDISGTKPSNNNNHPAEPATK